MGFKLNIVINSKYFYFNLEKLQRLAVFPYRQMSCAGTSLPHVTNAKNAVCTVKVHDLIMAHIYFWIN